MEQSGIKYAILLTNCCCESVLTSMITMISHTNCCIRHQIYLQSQIRLWLTSISLGFLIKCYQTSANNTRCNSYILVITGFKIINIWWRANMALTSWKNAQPYHYYCPILYLNENSLLWQPICWESGCAGTIAKWGRKLTGLLRELQERGLDFSRTQRVKIIRAIRARLLYIYMRTDQWVVVK